MRIRAPLSMWRVPPWPEEKRDDRTPVILCYHSVARVLSDPWGLRVTPRNFAEQMAVLYEYCNPVSLATLDEMIANGDVPPRTVAVTFDDGYADNLHTALPILKRHRIPATVFISTGYVGKKREYWWDELDRALLRAGRLPQILTLELNGQDKEWDLGTGTKLGLMNVWRARRWRAWQDHSPSSRHTILLHIRQFLHQLPSADRDRALHVLTEWAGTTDICRPSRRPLTMNELRDLKQSSLIEIGAHTVNHPSLARQDKEAQQNEITESKQWLEEKLGIEMSSFAYPYGSKEDFTSDTVELVKKAGFKRAVSADPLPMTTIVNRFEYPRRVVQDWNGIEFLQRLTRWFNAS